MFIELVTVETFDKRGRKHKRVIGRCTCTTCGVEFTRGNFNWQQYINDPSRPTFCSQNCSRPARRKGGISDIRLREQNKKRYGVDHVLQRPDVRQHLKQTLLERYGVDNPMKIKEINEQTKKTLQHKYGVNSAFHIPHNRAKLDYDVVIAKQLATMKRNGTFNSSKAEKRLHQLLCVVFSDVRTQVRIPKTHWVIDFYVKDINIWIQVDGIYWHGLDRPLNEIKASSKQRDQKIVRTLESDHRQNVWFAENGMKLLRITDAVIKQLVQLPDALLQIETSGAC